MKTKAENKPTYNKYVDMLLICSKRDSSQILLILRHLRKLTLNVKYFLR